MSNKEIAKTFQFLGDIMELYGENPFKIRSYQNAYLTLRKLDRPLAEMEATEIAAIKGVGQAIAEKIRELLDTGKMSTLQQYLDKTPEGVQEMLRIKGFGPKKIKVIWEEMGIETIGELLYAVNENRLLELKGFGEKTQNELRQQLQYFLKSRNQFHFASLETEGKDLLQKLQEALPGVKVEFTGAFRRHANILESIDVLVGSTANLDAQLEALGLQNLQIQADHRSGSSSNEYPLRIFQCSAEDFGSKQFKYSAAPAFMQAFLAQNPGRDFRDIAAEEEIFVKANLPFIPAELREEPWAIKLAQTSGIPQLLEPTDIKGVVHTHSTYSDGLNTLQEMAEYSKQLGYEYLVISDHSKAAFYANGLQPERVLSQMEEIDTLNKTLAPFRIFKGIECDILNDGSLDYTEDILAKFEVVIASVHTNLRMDEAKATQRVIKAVENPHTRILGHPTGRLLLSRQGYPLDHQKVIDACAANGVAIELNASPYRLDVDWTWIPYALEKGVMISINPDAHSKQGIHDIHYGVLSARKGGLTAAQCLNAKGVNNFVMWIESRTR
ncbi:MAG TPA: helix-hairpin-helix domain-containing protein [Haliscomenobacter sp.]|uniref:helix-hairpin-helix domain-containing protein n=1 Tax=Haliscomenobacter sp. TaxID=2717303 RepID=UPI002D0C087A|nr:helix-hairpin-helix domain-containing protein [Haliscomenobacter sp.]HOY18638.1 helix-hairpin-helix domain-containing protein [Haliscomenobacter sp.]HPH19118.1 helix-hairpin-helix domain-containing protein [Haliscomenobacter sp.]